MGVGHGETSCILLPSVCKYNLRGQDKDSRISEQQARAVKILNNQTEVKQLLESKGLQQGDLGSILDVIIRELGMPRSLSTFGIGRDKLDELAEHSLEDKWCRTNPIPLTEKSQVLDILETVVD